MIPLGVMASGRVEAAAADISSVLTHSAGSGPGAFSGAVPIGNPSADRQVVVVLCSQTQVDQASGLTVNGVAATEDAYNNVRNRIWVMRAAVPAGTTAILDFELNASNYNFYVYALYGAAGLAGTAQSADSVTLAGTAPGDALIAASMGWSNSAAPTWSGDVTFDASEANTPTGTNRGSVASGTATAASSTATVHWANEVVKPVVLLAYR